MGDPAGIGPEIIVKALSDRGIYRLCRPVVLGDLEIFSSTIGRISQEMSLNIISGPTEVKAISGNIDLMAVSMLKGEPALPGKPTVEAGKAMVDCILKAVGNSVPW
jgi:4-hydroxythreonine-4-phosphate dehydrogenase